MRYRNTLFIDGDRPFTTDDEHLDPALATLTQMARTALMDEYSTIKAAPANTGTPGKRTPAERARLAALARWGKYKKHDAPAAPTDSSSDMQARMDAATNRQAALTSTIGAEALDAMQRLAGGETLDDAALIALRTAGLVDNQGHLNRIARQLYNAAGRGDAAAIRAAMGALKPGEKPKEEKPKGGGGGGGKGKEKEEKPDARQARQQTAMATAVRMGLTADDATALYEARENGSAASPRMQALGLLDADGVPTSEGDRALRALEQGDAGAFRRAVRSAVDKRMRDAEAVAPGEDAPKHTTRSTRRKDDGTVITVRETKHLKYSRRHSASDEAAMQRGMTHLKAARAAFVEAGAPDSDGDGEPDMFEPATKGIPVVGTDYDSVIVCLAVPDDVQALLTDIIDDEAAEPDHVTIWYLGKASALESHKGGIIRALSLLSESAAPIRGTLGGFARFNASESSDNQDVLVALVDSPDLPFAHASVVEAVERGGVDHTPTHGFIPHITLAYIPPDTKTPNISIPREPVVFDELTLVWAGERIDFPLLGDSWEDEDEDEDVLPDARPAMAMGGDGVKMLADGRVAGYAVRFGDEAHPDISPMRDYFTKSTDFWLGQWDKRPMLYHHAQDPQTADAPVVGAWVKATVDDVGVWLEGQLDQAHRYYGAITELINRGALKLSSDSAPHLVRRVRHGGAHEVTRWPLLAASLTPTPAEPRLMPVSALKAAFTQAGLLPPAELIDERPEADAHDVARDADGMQAAHAHAVAVELELIALALLEAA